MFENPSWKLKVNKDELDKGISNYKKEIKVRKDHSCINCQSLIKKGTVALVHNIQYGAFNPIREYYCKNCYVVSQN